MKSETRNQSYGLSGDNEAGTVGLYLINSCVAVEVLSIDWPKLTLH